MVAELGHDRARRRPRAVAPGPQRRWLGRHAGVLARGGAAADLLRRGEWRRHPDHRRSHQRDARGWIPAGSTRARCDDLRRAISHPAKRHWDDRTPHRRKVARAVARGGRKRGTGEAIRLGRRAHVAPERIRRGVGRETGRGARPAVRCRGSARSERRSGGSGTRLQVADGVPLRAGCLARHGSVRGHRQRSCGSALAFRSAGGPPHLGTLHTAPRPHRARLLGVRGKCALAVCGGDQCRRGATDQRVRGRATGASRVRER